LVLLVLWLVVPIFLPFFLSQFLTPIYLMRYLILASPPFYLLVAHGILQWNCRVLYGIILFLILFIFPINVFSMYHRQDKESWRKIAQELETRAEPQDILLIHPPYYWKTTFEYYYRKTDLTVITVSPHDWSKQEGKKEQLTRLCKGHPRVWVLYHPQNITSPVIVEYFENNYIRKYHQAFKRLELSLYQEPDGF